jgi:DNA-binding GntR family transcriptional regulator
MENLPTIPDNDAVSTHTTSLGSRVQAELEQLIAQRHLRPGERLNEVTLARRLGVSRGPVREAARALERKGLVTVILNRGAFVRTLTIDEAMEIYDLNAVLFGFAASRVAASVTAAQAIELRDLVDGMDSAGTAMDREAFFALNVRFHDSILAFAANRQVQAVYAEYTRKLLLLRRRSFDRKTTMAEANAEHRRVLDAILAGDPEQARRRAEEHTRSGRARFLSAIDYSAPET